MASTWGKLITFEGIDGSGKSTQVALLAERLEARGVKVTTTREPGGSPFAETMRDLILSGQTQVLGPVGEAFIFNAIRHDHVNTIIKPALEAGGWVLCDRFSLSTLVYQGFEGGAPLEQLQQLGQIATNGVQPDLTFILDIPVDLAIARADSRRGKQSPADRFEREGDLMRRRVGFLHFSGDDYPKNIIINGSQPVDIISDTIISYVEELLADS